MVGYHGGMDGSFAILEHSGCGLVHFDFLIEDGDILATWQFDRSPVDIEAGSQLSCQKIQDHRLLYLRYVGKISGGRGVVRRIEQGQYQSHESGESLWRFKLAGKTMRGEFLLTKLTREGNSDWWMLVREAEAG